MPAPPPACSAKTGAPRAAAPMPTALPMATRRVALRRYGEAEQLIAENAECPAPREGEVRIRQRAIGVNFIDVYLRRGWIPGMLPITADAPGVLGMEAAGSVYDVGPNVSHVMPGDRVAYLGPMPGAYCSVRCVPASWVLRLPAAVEDDTAAALLLKGLTADYLLRDLGGVRAGTRLLVHAAPAASANWCARGQDGSAQRSSAPCPAKKRRAIAGAHGCEHVIVTRDYRFADAVQQACRRCGCAHRRPGRRGARARTWPRWPRRGHWISLGQASGAAQRHRPRCARRQVAELLAPGGLRLRPYTRAVGRARAAPVGRAGRRHSESADDRAPLRWTPPVRHMRGWSRG